MDGRRKLQLMAAGALTFATLGLSACGSDADTDRPTSNPVLGPVGTKPPAPSGSAEKTPSIEGQSEVYVDFASTFIPVTLRHPINWGTSLAAALQGHDVFLPIDSAGEKFPPQIDVWREIFPAGFNIDQAAEDYRQRTVSQIELEGGINPDIRVGSDVNLRIAGQETRIIFGFDSALGISIIDYMFPAEDEKDIFYHVSMSAKPEDFDMAKEVLDQMAESLRFAYPTETTVPLPLTELVEDAPEAPPLESPQGTMSEPTPLLTPEPTTPPFISEMGYSIRNESGWTYESTIYNNRPMDVYYQDRERGEDSPQLRISLKTPDAGKTVMDYALEIAAEYGIDTKYISEQPENDSIFITVPHDTPETYRHQTQIFIANGVLINLTYRALTSEFATNHYPETISKMRGSFQFPLQAN